MENKPQVKAESSYTVDPLSDLVSARELRVWRSQPTTQKLMRYLNRWRSQLMEMMAEGGSTEPTIEGTALRTAEFVAKAQLLKDILTLEAKDIADFYTSPEPKDDDK